VVIVALAGHGVVLALWPDAHVLMIDLQVYRAGAEHVLGGQPLYDGGVLLTLPFVYPPFAAVAFVPLVALPLVSLKVLWTGATLALLGYVVHRALRSLGAPAPALFTVAAVAVATWLDPVRTTLYLGQINVVLLAVVLGDVLGRRDSRWRGVGVGLAAAIKLTPLLFVLYLLLVGRVRAALTAAGTFVAAVAVGFLVAPADSAAYWLRGTFAAADRISAVAATTNHSLNGLLARTLGESRALYLAGAALLVAGALALAVRAHRRGDELLGVTLVGLCTCAVAPFAWSHHWVWVLPLLVVLVHRAAWVMVSGTLIATVAVITALPGPAVGPIPRTGLISLWPDTYMALFVAVLAWALTCSRVPLLQPDRSSGTLL
jgi:alpha-1,2-mannosyltransferase